MGELPDVNVFLKKTQLVNKPGLASKIAVVGAFNSEETNPQLFVSVDDAQTTFGDDATFNGCAVVPYLFIGASSLLCVNTTTWTGTGDNKTADKTLTTAKLSEALAKIKGEDFDILFVAENITDAFMPIITAFCDECFHIKMPVGYGASLTGATAAANVTTAGLAGEHCYALNTQQLGINGNDPVSVLLSTAYYIGLIAGMNVGNTMTMKTVDGVTSVSPELTFETGDAGKALLEAGITCFKCQDRTSGRYVVVNSEQPNGLDLYINRVRNFVVKEFALHQFLGDRNRPKSHNQIEQEIDRVKDMCVNTLDLLEDIQYKVVKKSASCVDIYIDSLVFAGIITHIDVYVRVEVE
ncbi:MAG: hypothetical protein IJ287_03075 [Methanobrevibacter sp.]|nr:hypothetical protein [Methanobrevibacter sp.]MBR1748861.1 hypothetical protein [Bacilli bacterium]